MLFRWISCFKSYVPKLTTFEPNGCVLWKIFTKVNVRCIYYTYRFFNLQDLFILFILRVTLLILIDLNTVWVYFAQCSAQRKYIEWKLSVCKKLACYALCKVCIKLLRSPCYLAGVCSIYKELNPRCKQASCINQPHLWYAFVRLCYVLVSLHKHIQSRECYLQGNDYVPYGRNLLTFRRNELPPSLGYKITLCKETKEARICKIWGFHGGDYDDHLLGNMPYHTQLTTTPTPSTVILHPHPSFL
jgi:hypothetical protein